MPPETTDTLVIGGGQAGLAMSAHLGAAGVPHIVLERGRIAERWRSGRWDSLVANGPVWHDRFPDMAFDGLDPDGFAPKEDVAAYFAAYADKIAAPIRCGVEAREARRLDGRQGFRVETSDGPVETRRMVVATGAFQTPVIPNFVPATAGVAQMHSADYRNPGQLAEGAVLVVGGGSSGAQIADELLRAGRRVYLSVGPHDRPPRSYRGLDYCWWLGVLGLWDAPAPAPDSQHVTIAVSGAHGGFTVDFRRFAERGMTLLGRA
ncbi:MAG: NAD(P)/FAD-dependent oxidoreductase, partial [Pseudomonadota bacterium]